LIARIGEQLKPDARDRPVNAPRFTFFLPTESQPRARRASDAVTAATGIVLIGWGIYGAERLTPFEIAIQDLVGALPSWVTSLMGSAYAFGLLYCLGLVVALVIGGRRLRNALRDVLASLIGSILLALALAQLLGVDWALVQSELDMGNPAPHYPVMRVVVVVATLVAVSPYVGRPVRRLGWIALLLTTIAAVALGYGDPSDAFGAMGTGMLVSGIALLIAGSPRGYPDPHAVAASLRSMGLQVSDVRIDLEQSWGVRRFVGTDADGSTLAIKAYGRDAADSMRISKAWRTLWYRESGRVVGFSRLQAVEHEALVTMMAARAGVSVAEVFAAGEPSGDMALLVQRGGDPTLLSKEAAEIGDDLLAAIWQQVKRLHDASISHRALTTKAILVGGGTHAITDFSLGALVADRPECLQDNVELLFSMALQVGPTRTVEAAAVGLGVDELAATLPYLQVPAVSLVTRRQTDHAKELIHDLQTTITEAIGVAMPEPVELRRVSGKNLATAALLILAVSTLISMLAGIDFAEVWAVIEDATWGLLVLALIVSQSMFIPDAMGMMYAVGGQLPFWPLVTLQVAAKFISLAVPTFAGRVATNGAFLHHFGFNVTVAATQGAIDGLGGFLVEAAILILAIFAGDLDLGLDFESGDVAWGIVLVVATLLALVVIATVRKVKRLREKVLPVIEDAKEALLEFLKKPGRALGLLASNLGTRLLMAGSLWLVLIAIDAEISFAACLVAVAATNLLQGIIPVPGGIGVTETVMTGLLVGLGVEQTSAFAAAITWRVFTFYLPSAEGFFAMRWLERHQYL
jgi:uncharacterized protein (TIRG00374 family)